jgi:hypothetical protein
MGDREIGDRVIGDRVIDERRSVIGDRGDRRRAILLNQRLASTEAAVWRFPL